MKKEVRFGIIGGGLMGKEAASAFGRWFMLRDFPVNAKLVAVCDTDHKVLKWYEKIDSVEQLTTSYDELLQNADVDAVYIAIPHHLHFSIFSAALNAGKDLLAEKPFCINPEEAKAIHELAKSLGRFVRVSSEFPFLPGPQQLIRDYKSGSFGRIMEVNAGFYHSSDMDPLKPINWKRQVKYCGEIGVMGDLGMHVLHIPLLLNWKPRYVFAQLQKIITQRPDGKGGMAEADTWNNATLNTFFDIESEEVPMRLEMKRLAPGELNSWWIEVLGTDGGGKYNSCDTKGYRSYIRKNGNQWQRTELGFASMAYSVESGGIFEPGFADCLMQMFAAFVAEKEGMLNDRTGCVKPEDAVYSQLLFAAALRSAKNRTVEAVVY
jgi:predicted dehydrogenase